MARSLTVPTIFSAVDKMSKPLSKMSKNAGAAFAKMDRSMRKIQKTAFKTAKVSAGIGIAIIAPLGLMANEAVKFEDKMADVAKTTGLAGKELIEFGDSLRKLSTRTRTSIEDLQKIAQIGGQLGISPDQLVAFTEAADKFNIAMGEDFGGVEEAVAQVGKLKNLFQKTRDLDISDVINKAGSAINFLGAKGASTSASMTDFALGIGALPDALKPSIENTLALGAFLEELGIESKRGASGVTGLFLKAGADIGGFAKQMEITKMEAKSLLAQDPLEFAKKFSKTFNGLAPDVLSKKLGELGLNSKEVIKVVGALGSATDRMTELQVFSNKAFKEGTSLSEEAATKNATMAAKLAIAKNKMQDLAITLGNVLIPVISDLMEAVTPIIERFSRWAKNNKGTLKSIMKMAVGVAGLAFAISGISGAIAIAAKAFKILNIVMSLNPAILITGAILALGAALYSATDGFTAFTSAQKVANEVTQRALDNTIDQRTEITVLFKALRKVEVGTEAYASVLAKIEQISPGITKQYNLQAGALDDINRAEKELTASILKRAETEARAEILKEKTKARILREQEGPSLFESFTGFIGGPNAEFVNKLEIQSLKQEEDILAEQIAEDQLEAISTKGTAQEFLQQSITESKESVEVVIRNETGNQVDVNGGNSISMANVGITNGQ